MILYITILDSSRFCGIFHKIFYCQNVELFISRSMCIHKPSLTKAKDAKITHIWTISLVANRINTIILECPFSLKPARQLLVQTWKACESRRGPLVLSSMPRTLAIPRVAIACTQITRNFVISV